MAILGRAIKQKRERSCKDMTDITNFILKGQHSNDRTLTRNRFDIPAMIECNEITTGPGRYRLGVPNAFGFAAYIPDPTIRIQKWGASHDMSSTKTDVESDLWNLNRPLTRTACGNYTPSQNTHVLTPMPEMEFPMTHTRLVDPPCTLRASGWNRWEWLGEDPQQNIMMPFEWGIDSRHAAKDGYSEKLLSVMKGHHSFVDPGQPIAQRNSGIRDHTNTIGGISALAPTGTPSRVQPRNPSDYISTSPSYVDRTRAITGIMTAPPIHQSN